MGRQYNVSVQISVMILCISHRRGILLVMEGLVICLWLHPISGQVVRLAGLQSFRLCIVLFQVTAEAGLRDHARD